MRQITARCVTGLLLLTCTGLYGQVNLNLRPSRILGHPRLVFPPDTGSPNLVDGRGLSSPQSVAVDTTVTPPLLYVSDSGNNRVLGWRNASSFAKGAPADVVIGQKDFLSTTLGGPGRPSASGFFAPAGIAVDTNPNSPTRGDLYVVDAGNNRILRFPKPFAQGDISVQLPNLVIGQTGLSCSTCGRPNSGGVTASGISTSNVLPSVHGSALAFDPQGNLWFLDAGNHRVLRYPASALGPDVPSGPAADRVVGQADFNSNTPFPQSLENRARKTGLFFPSGIGLDPQGRLYVADNLSRVLVYNSPAVRGDIADRILGVVPVTPPTPSECPNNALRGGTIEMAGPEGIFFIAGAPGVVDTLNHRIVLYDAPDQWPAEAVQFSPRWRVPLGPLGQIGNCGEKPNRDRAEPGPDTLSLPTHAVLAGGELFVADSGNHRVLVFSQAGLGQNSQAVRLLGQDEFDMSGANLLEGREFDFTRSGASGTTAEGGLVVNLRSDPPHLYISDTYNNRVLGYRDARRVRPGDKADLVIGQPDFRRNIGNYPNGPAKDPTDRSLLAPSGLALDGDGNLYVADTGNGRVLRFPNPFQSGQNYPRADLVIGQRSFFQKVQEATQITMAAPYGLAFAGDNGLLVSDVQHHRVLFFRGRARDLTSGMPATRAFGWPDFNLPTSGNSLDRMSSPRHISTDSDDRLYVADTGNNRILIFERAPLAIANPRAGVELTNVDQNNRLGNPRGIYVNPQTGEIWVGEGSVARVVRFPKFDDLPLQQNFANYRLNTSGGVVAVAQDAFGDVLYGEFVNRVAIHYPGTKPLNGALEVREVLTPGVIAVAYKQGTIPFSDTEAIAPGVPWPTDLNDLQVLVNDVPAPLYYVFPDKIAFQVPTGAPRSGEAEMQVVRKSTGQIIGAGPMPMDVASPGLFTTNSSGSGQIAALNEDNTINSAQNRIGRGKVIQLFGTGQGVIPGGPPDGQPATGAVETEEKPRVNLAGLDVPPANILYSGLAPGLVGVWQINVKIPDSIVPSPSVPVIIQYRSIFSTTGPSTRGTIAVQQN